MVLAGCSYTTARFHPDYDTYRPAISRLLLMQPQVDHFSRNWRMEATCFARRPSPRPQTRIRQTMAEVLASQFTRSTGGQRLAARR